MLSLMVFAACSGWYLSMQHNWTEARLVKISGFEEFSVGVFGVCSGWYPSIQRTLIFFIKISGFQVLSVMVFAACFQNFAACFQKFSPFSKSDCDGDGENFLIENFVKNEMV